MKRVAFAFPGKIGDLVYALPMIRKFRDDNWREIKYLALVTSEYCKPAVPLLQEQIYIDEVIIDHTYKPVASNFGMQPWEMKGADNLLVDTVFQLGFERSMHSATIMRDHLSNAHALTMKMRYNIEVKPDLSRPYLEAEPMKKNPYFNPFRKKYIAINLSGTSFGEFYKPEYKQALETLFTIFLKRMRKTYEIVAVTDRAGKKYHKQFADKVIVTKDFLEVARILKRSAAFFGVQSAVYAVAEGLKIPRLVHFAFQNAIPSGLNAEMFTVACMVDTLERKFNRITKAGI